MTADVEVPTVEAVVTTADATVAVAAKLMRQHDVGAVLVLDGKAAENRCAVGVVTDHDLVVEVIALDLDANTITVGDLVDNGLTRQQVESRVRRLLDGMRGKGVDRLPMAPHGQLAGVLMIDELTHIVAGTAQPPRW